jgi:hypothetical protein
MGAANERFRSVEQEIPYGLEKAFEKNRYRPTYAGANVGHPSYYRWFLRR